MKIRLVHIGECNPHGSRHAVDPGHGLRVHCLIRDHREDRPKYKSRPRVINGVGRVFRDVDPALRLRDIVHGLIEVQPVVMESRLVTQGAERRPFFTLLVPKVIPQPVQTLFVRLAQPCDSGILRVRAKKPLRDEIPGLKQLASQHLQDGPHLNALRIVVQLAVADIVEAEHQQPVQHDEFVVRVHASDQLVALPVGKSFERLGVEVELDDLKVSAHEFSAIESHPKC
jgi:hypothetical protein